MSRHSSASAFHKSKTLNDKYMLGDEIGKGAYGRVYKGLDLENGDFVAIKQVSLENIPPEDLASIMSEIDLLKNLNHKNIVKYQGSFKTRTHLYIILEFVENGSLANNIKPNKFGALPENVVGRYIGQVLEGLVYLHEQGVIHRDIKGANILTTKEGEVKLADFGVATKLTEADINTHSVVGTPYWMAPEVIEMSGVSAASDIWSVGCTVIELLTCVPPYYDLQPMPALFRIVQDDHPPLPEHISGVIIDFLKQCFRKDAKLRPDAQTLLDHAWIRKSRKEKSNGKNGVIRDIPRDLSTSAHAVIKENKIQGLGPPSEDGHATRDPFESGSDDDLKCNGHSPTTSYEASSTRSNSVGNRAPLRIPSHGIAHFQRLPGSHEQEYLDTLTTKLAPTPTLTPLTRPPISTRASESPDSIGFNQELHRMLHDGSRQGGAEEQLRREIGQERGTTEKLPLLLQDEEDGEVNGPLEVPEIQVQRKGNQLVRAVTNVPDSPLQGGKSSFVHLRKLSDTPGDGSLKDILDDPFIRSHEATTSASIGHGLPPRSASALDAHVLSAKLKAKMVQKRVEVEGLSTPKKDGDEIFSSMIDVVDDDDFGRPGLGLMNRREGRDYLAKQALEVSRLMALLKPDEIEEVVLMTCQKLTSIFQGFPDKKQQLIKPHGFIPLMDLLDVNNNRVVYAALQVLNEITHDNVDLLESACHVGLIPLMMGFASPECSREMRMQAAYFVQQLCHNSSLTLQMFIACRGLPVLVSFLEPDYAKYREMVHKAIDGMWQVFELRSSTARNDFCRIFAKSGVLVRLVNTLHNLNEATRVPSTSSTVDKPSNKLESSNERLTLKTRSGPIEQSRTANTEHFKPRSGQLDQTRARSTHVDYHRTVAGLNAVDSSRIPPGQAHRPSALPDYLWQSFPGQVETSGQYSGQLNPSRVATSSEHLRHSDPFQQGLGESTWTLGGDSGRDDEVRSDGEQRPLLADEHWGSNDPTSRGLHALPDQAQHDQAGFYFMMNEKPSTFFEKDVYVKPVSGPLDQMRQLPDRETALPLLHHSGALRRMNGDFDSVMVGLTDHEKQNGAIEMGHLPPPKFAWLGTGNTSPSAKLSPSTSARMNPKLSGALSITAEPVTTLSGLASQTASGLLSVSGVLHARQGSATSSGLLSRMHSSLNPDEAREYVAKVADLLLEFSRADTIVKSHMCSISLLIRLLQMLNKLEAPILVKVLKCIKQLSQDPYTLEYLQRADAMKHLVPFLEAREGPYVSQIHNQVLNALHNLCKINKRRQEQAAESGIIPHLIHFIRTDSPLKQYALPLLCDMAHASRYTREQLRSRGGLEVYLGLLDDESWAVTALDSLAVCLAHDNDQRKVEQTLLRKEALHKLVTFFASCEGPSSVHILEPFLKIIMKSVRLNTALAVSGLTPLLVARLDHQDAIARLTLLKLIRAVYEHHPRPKQLIVEHELPAKLQRLIEERRDGERSGGQVLVKQMAFSLLKALHINTVL